MIKVRLIAEPFDQIIDVYIGTDIKAIEKHVNKMNKPEEELVLDSSYTNSTAGTFYILNTKSGPYRFICLNKFSQENIQDLQNFIHELYHAIHHILKYVEVKTIDSYDELTAYLLDNLLGKFLTKIKRKSFKTLTI